MAYHLRVLTPQDTMPSPQRLQTDLEADFPGIRVLPEAPGLPAWENLVIRHPEGVDLALLCRISLEGSPAGREKKRHIREETRHGRPLSAARWLRGYLKKIRVLYEIHPTEDVHLPEGWHMLLLLRLALWEQVRGILHTPDEGFTNPEGDLILWEYPASATGLVPAAVRRFGRFRSFSLNLASPRHRQAFFQGKIPPS